jgi:hypothetical protein
MVLSKILKTVLPFFLILATLFFSACSTKEVYKPKIVKGDWGSYAKSDHSLVDVTSNVALLDNSHVLTSDGVLDTKIKDSFRLIGKSQNWIISSNIDGNLTLQNSDDKNSTVEFELKKTVAAASVKDDILAVLFADNEMALYAISSKEVLFKAQGNSSGVVDSKIVNPHFMSDLVLFLTLDGKVIIINSKLKKKLRTTIVSSENYFNNIIYFNVLNNRLIAATGTKILSLAKKELRADYEIRDVICDDKNIYIATKQGEIVSLTPDLQVNAKVKFPFAHFLGMLIHNDKIYALEKEGYIIELSKDLLTYDVYEADIDDGYVYTARDMFMIDDEKILFK